MTGALLSRFDHDAEARVTRWAPRVTMPDGSTLDEYFGSDNEAILEGTKANHGVNRGGTKSSVMLATERSIRRNCRMAGIAEPSESTTPLELEAMERAEMSTS